MEILVLIAVLLSIGAISAFSSSSYDRGEEGESLIHRRLAKFERKGTAKLLTNIYVPKVGGGTTEIDVLLIHQKGLFVFESKNYSGWIFGNETHKNWTQTLPKGRRGDVHKERFYNPILQNAGHIRHLIRHIGKNIPVWSIVVFSDECELKDITVSSKNVRVVRSRHVCSTVEEICAETLLGFLTETDIIEIYNSLLVNANSSEEDREHHAKKVREVKQRFQG